MLQRNLIRILLLTILLATAGCSTTPSLDEPEGNQPSMIYGHIDMEDAPCKLGWVTMKQMRPKTDKPYYNFWIDEGTFFRINVPPGTYKFDEFGGAPRFGNTIYTFSFPDQGKGEMDRQIKRQGLYYVGSYKYKKIKTRFWQQGKFDLEKTKGPSEKEILQKILPYAKHPFWIKKINERLKQLGA
ncbi:MAG: hypothetical protein OEY67_05145 [Gammaproteobacteria bacterium]|nr:hypothetical protein [Gammaproteobacteria bacterium]